MIEDLDETMRQVLDDPAAPPRLRNAATSFETPDRTFTVQELTVNLFLHGLKENVEVRDVVPVIRRKAMPSSVRRRPCVRDCSYVVTAWSNETGAAKISAEHALLGQALAWLKRFPMIPFRLLVGAMADQPFPLVVTVGWADTTSTRGEFWGALGTSPRPSFDVEVTVAMDLGMSFDEAMVTTVEHAYRLELPLPDHGDLDRSYHIGGRVVDPAGHPLQGVLVEAASGGTTTTDARANGCWHHSAQARPPGHITLTRLCPCDRADRRAGHRRRSVADLDAGTMTAVRPRRGTTA